MPAHGAAGSTNTPIHWSQQGIEGHAISLRVAEGDGADGLWSAPVAAQLADGVVRHVAIPLRHVVPDHRTLSQPIGWVPVAWAVDIKVSFVRQTCSTLTVFDVTQWPSSMHGACEPSPSLGVKPELDAMPAVVWTEPWGGRPCSTAKAFAARRSGTDDGEVEVLVLRYSVRLVAPGCLALVLESLTPRPPYVLENRTPHPLFFRQAALHSLPYQELPPYAAAGFCWRLASGSPQEVPTTLELPCAPDSPLSRLLAAAAAALLLRPVLTEWRQDSVAFSRLSAAHKCCKASLPSVRLLIARV